MLNKFFTKPVELKIGGQICKFCSIADFEFSLGGRTAVPSKKITDMVRFSTDQLKKEAKTIKDIEKRFVAILSRSIENTSSINRALRELDPVIFSQDHGWRDIISALNEGDDDLNPFRRIALVKYMQYLSARQEIIKYLYSEKKKMLKEDNGDVQAETGLFKDTVILENTVFEPVSSGTNGNFERLPKGEAVTVVINPDEEIEILLSRHPCKLVTDGDTIGFIDSAGKKHALKKGRNVIGRDAISTIMIDPELRDVSRIHIVIETFDNSQAFQITDLSSHGTYIQQRYLESKTGT